MKKGNLLEKKKKREGIKKTMDGKREREKESEREETTGLSAE